MRNDLLEFCQYILDRWELDTKDIQDRAEKLVEKYGEDNKMRARERRMENVSSME